jgi:uncharacterized protein DUF6152
MITTRVVATAAGIVLALAVFVAPVRAHHSTAMYDMSQRKSIQGAIKTVEWTNPQPSGPGTWESLDAAPDSRVRGKAPTLHRGAAESSCCGQ